jgi:hypothetical protein
MKLRPTALRAAFLSPLLTLTVQAPCTAQTYRDLSGTTVPGVVIIDPYGAGPLGTSANPMKISGSFAATLSGFTPTPAYTSLSISATGVSYTVALPGGAVVVVYNTGSNDAYVKLGTSTVTASASNDVVKAGGWMAFTVGANTYLAAYATAGTTALNLSGGSGLPTGSGGAGGGGSIPTGSAGSPSASVVSVQGVSGGVPTPQNQTQVAGTVIATGAGASNLGTQRVAVSTDSPGGASANAAYTTPRTGAFTFPGATVGTSSAQALAAGAYNHVQIQNTSVSASIACAWGASAVLNASGSILLTPGQSALWGPTTSGVPASALNCIASAASTPLYLESN